MIFAITDINDGVKYVLNMDHLSGVVIDPPEGNEVDITVMYPQAIRYVTVNLDDAKRIGDYYATIR